MKYCIVLSLYINDLAEEINRIFKTACQNDGVSYQRLVSPDKSSG